MIVTRQNGGDDQMIPPKVSDTEEPESSKRLCWLPSRDLLDTGEVGTVLDICGKETPRLRKQESATSLDASGGLERTVTAYFPGAYVPGQCLLATMGRSDR